MQDALKSVLDYGVFANKAAVMYGIPPSTIKDHLSGCVTHGSRS